MTPNLMPNSLIPIADVRNPAITSLDPYWTQGSFWPSCWTLNSARIRGIGCANTQAFRLPGLETPRMPLTKNKPYEKWPDRKEREMREAVTASTPKRPRGRPRNYPPPEPPRKPIFPGAYRPRKPRAPRFSVPCPGCGTPTKPGGKFCGRSCSGKSARRWQLEWEKSIANELTDQGWTIMSPTACCDRIGVKNGKAYFIEFKPEGQAMLRAFQQVVQVVVPHMYLIAEGTKAGKLAHISKGRR